MAECRSEVSVGKDEEGREACASGASHQDSKSVCRQTDRQVWRRLSGMTGAFLNCYDHYVYYDLLFNNFENSGCPTLKLILINE